jgi:hypothetical protein
MFLAIIILITCFVAFIYGIFQGMFPLVAHGTFNVIPMLYLLPLTMLLAYAWADNK